MIAGSSRRHFTAIALLCVALQLASATWFVSDFDTPNASTSVARSLAAGGPYAVVIGARLWGPSSPRAREPLRYFVLPGEPLYLAASFRLLPEPLHRYVHLPVTALLIASITAFAAVVGGTRLALATAIIASLEPFVIVHGPVWDDTFLAAALQWSALTLLAITVYETRRPRSLPAAASTAAAAIAIGVATLVRGDVPLFVALLVLVAWWTPALRALRWPVLYCAVASGAALMAWGARNSAVVGSFAFGSSHDGITLWESNGPYTAAALERGQVMMLSFRPDLMGELWSDTRAMTEPEANRYYGKRALQYIAAHPINELRLMVRKAIFTLTGLRPELSLASSRNLAGAAANIITFLLAAIGIGALLGDREQARRFRPLFLLLLPLVLTGVLAVLIGPIGMRYRIAADGVLWILAGMGVLRIVDTWWHPDPSFSAHRA